MKEKFSEKIEGNCCSVSELKKIFDPNEIKIETNSFYPWNRYNKLSSHINKQLWVPVLAKMDYLYSDINSKTAIHFASFDGDTQLPASEIFIEKIFPIILSTTDSDKFTTEYVVEKSALLSAYKKAIKLVVLDYVFKKYPEVLEGFESLDDDYEENFIAEYAKKIQNDREKQGGFFLSKIINLIFMKVRNLDLSK